MEITINRPLASNIDRMLAEAVRYREEDERQREKVVTRNNLKGYVFSVKQALDQAGDNLTDSDKSTVRSKCDEVIRWLDASTLAEKEKELMQTCTPVMSKMHGAATNAGCGLQDGTGYGGQRPGPTVEGVA